MAVVVGGGVRLCSTRSNWFVLAPVHPPLLSTVLWQGANGFSGISANYYPQLHAYLCAQPTDSPSAAKVQRCLAEHPSSTSHCVCQFPKSVREHRVLCVPEVRAAAV